MNHRHDPDRREFLRHVGRVAILGALALGAGAIAVRNGVCTRGGACQQCGTQTACQLPDAIAFRQQTGNPR